MLMIHIDFIHKVMSNFISKIILIFSFDRFFYKKFSKSFFCRNRFQNSNSYFEFKIILLSISNSSLKFSPISSKSLLAYQLKNFSISKI